jgi:general stress protein 26
MNEDPADFRKLQQLLDSSLAGASEHMHSIIRPERAVPAADLVRRLTGMRTLALATVSAGGHPRISAVDGHLLRGRWVFTTSGSSVKAADMRSRPHVSAAYLEGDSFGVCTHGTAEFLTAAHPDRPWIEEHLTRHYGASPSSWGPDIVYVRIQPSWMVGFSG